MATQSGPQLGATLYAFTNEYLDRQYSFEDLLAQVAGRGLGPSVEVIGFQSIRGFPEVTDAFADRFKELMAQHGLTPSSLASNSDRFLAPGKPMSDAELVAYHRPQLQAAAKLGFPVMRYQYAAPPEVIRELAPMAEDLGVKLGLEIHAPYDVNHPTVLKYREMYAQVRSPALGWIPDFGATALRIPVSLLNAAREKGAPEGLIDILLDVWPTQGEGYARAAAFRAHAEKAGYRPDHIGMLSLPFFILSNHDAKGWAEIVSETVHIHGKFYGVDDEGREEAIDYETILPIFRDGGFAGTMCSEWEGHAYRRADAFDMVAKHQAMCRRILAQ